MAGIKPTNQGLGKLQHHNLTMGHRLTQVAAIKQNNPTFSYYFFIFCRYNNNPTNWEVRKLEHHSFIVGHGLHKLHKSKILFSSFFNIVKEKVWTRTTKTKRKELKIIRGNNRSWAWWVAAKQGLLDASRPCKKCISFVFFVENMWNV